MREVKLLYTSPHMSITHINIDITMQNMKTKTSRWIVSHVLSFASESHYNLCLSRQKKGIALLPHGAAALLLDSPHYRGKVCNYFPLSGWECGPPLLLHAQWDVHSSRKSIPLPSERNAGRNDAEKWNGALIWGPLARSLAGLLVECKSIVMNGGLQLSTYKDLLALEDSTNAASSALRSQLSVATIHEVMTQQREVFPVAVDCNKKNPTVLDCKSSEVIQLRVPLHKLSDCVQDHLARQGLPLSVISDRVLSAMQTYHEERRSSSVSPQQLSPQYLCGFLRSNRPSVEIVDKLLVFIVKTRGFFFRSLSGVPLLRVRSGEVLEFGNQSKAIFHDHFELLPHMKQQFLGPKQKEILLTADNSREKCLEGASVVGIRSFRSVDLLEHHGILHETILLERPADGDDNESWQEWCKIFWRLVWMDMGNGASIDYLDQFGSWRVLHVCTAEGGHALIPLSDGSSVFMLHGVDNEWQQAIADILWRLGFHILAPDPSRDANMHQLLKARVQSGDMGLCRLIACSTQSNNLANLTVKHRKDLLEYFTSRRELSAAIQCAIKAMPLFLRANKTGEKDQYTPLGAGVIHIAMHSNPDIETDHTGNLTRLSIPDIVHLAQPPRKITQLYKQLGVIVLSASDFVKTYVCPYLPEAARCDYNSVLRPILDELASWVVDEILPSGPIVEKIVSAAQAQMFVRTSQGDQRVRPCMVTHPFLPVTEVF